MSSSRKPIPTASDYGRRHHRELVICRPVYGAHPPFAFPDRAELLDAAHECGGCGRLVTVEGCVCR